MKLKYTVLAGALLASVSQAANAEVIISPRFSYYFDNINQRGSGIEAAGTPGEEEIADANRQFQDILGPTASVDFDVEGSGGASSQIALPMYGLAGTYVDGDFSITLTGMYGEGDSQLTSVGAFTQTFSIFGETATDVLTTSSVGTQEFERIDIELTAQKRINERFAVLGGVRYENVDSTGVINSQIVSSVNFLNLINSFGFVPPDFQVVRDNTRTDVSIQSEVFSARGGVAGFIPFGEGNTVFLNGMLHLSHQPSADTVATSVDLATGTELSTITPEGSETTLGPDVSVGIQLSMAENVFFDIRYRGAFYFPVGGGRSFEDPRVNHGVNAGVSFVF